MKKKERYVYQNLLDKRKKIISKFQIKNLVRTEDLKKTFSKSNTTHWSYKLHEITEIIIDTIPSYCFDNLPERLNEALLEKTTLTMKKEDSVLKKIKYRLNQIKTTMTITAFTNQFVRQKQSITIYPSRKLF